MKQYEAVIKVMEENGGYATLGYLYENVLKVPDVNWKTKTPFASIRRIVQDERFFFKIRPGLWALKTYKDKLPAEILSSLNEDKEIENGETSTHTYYQGLIIEIGNIKGFKTCVPPQDKNKKFLNRTLKEKVTLSKIYNFTYRKVIQKIKSIDVFWFNERGFPVSVFEIEHSTDFKNALLKFLELQDFKINFNIVSYKERKEEFKSLLSYSAFKPIKENVRFLSYDHISYWHAKSYELKLTEVECLGNSIKNF